MMRNGDKPSRCSLCGIPHKGGVERHAERWAERHGVELKGAALLSAFDDARSFSSATNPQSELADMTALYQDAQRRRVEAEDEAGRLGRELAKAREAFNTIAKEGLKRADEADALRSAIKGIDVLRLERDHAQAHYENARRHLTAIYALLNPPITQVGDKRYKFINPLANEALHALSDAIRAIPEELRSVSSETKPSKWVRVPEGEAGFGPFYEPGEDVQLFCLVEGDAYACTVKLPEEPK